MSKHESDYMGRVKSLPCVLCSLLGQPQTDITEAHHIRTGHGMGDRASDFLTIALCVSCHRGTHGFHGTKAMMRIAKLSEMDLLAETIRLMDKKEGRESLPSTEKISPTDSKQEDAVSAKTITDHPTTQPRDLRRRNRSGRSVPPSPV